MKSMKFLTSHIVTAGAMCLALAGPAWGQQGCIDPLLVFPDPVDPLDSSKYIFPGDTTEYSIPSPSVTEFGSNLTCEDIDGQFGGRIPNGIGRVTFYNDDQNVQFTVDSSVSDGIASWSVMTPTVGEVRTDPITGEPYTVLPAIDTSITDAAQGGNGCLATHIADAVEGQLAYRKSNGSTTLRNLYVCSDNEFDAVGLAPPASAPPVESCELLSGESIIIDGVTITCPALNPGQQKTIIVTTDDEPGYGFINEQGVIDFENVCICSGDAGPGVIEEQCNPNPEGGFQDPALGDLPDCIIEDAPVGVEFEITNPRCVTVGGRRSCY